MEYTAREKAMIAHFRRLMEAWNQLWVCDVRTRLEDCEFLNLMAYLSRIERRLPNAYFASGQKHRLTHPRYEEFSFRSTPAKTARHMCISNVVAAVLSEDTKQSRR